MGGLETFKATVEDGGHIIADRRLFRTADNRIVEVGDADARYLFAGGAGDVIPVDQVKAYRLEVKDGKVVQGEVAPAAPVGQLSDAEKDAQAIGLKRAADARREADLGKSQTEVALTEAPAVDEDAMAAARARHAADHPAAAPAAEPEKKPAAKSAAKRTRGK